VADAGEKEEAERIAERAIETVQTAREEHRRLDPGERAKLERMQRHPEARREVARTRLGMTVLLLGGLVLLTVLVVYVALRLLQ
jgi:hypothetical protein